MKFSALNRDAILKEMGEEEFDVLVVGGGITGCGIAFDAVTRGLKTALVEMQDFAGGTSSRSTKLVHGGLRYLKHFEVGLVAEVGKERAIVYENGLHVTTPEWMLLPIYKDGTFGKIATTIGLSVYDFLAGVSKEERRIILSRDETIEKEPLIKREGLIGGGYYVEYRTDDARLTIEVIKEAVENGVKAVNYAKVIDLLYKEGIVSGARVKNQIDGVVYDIYAKKVINATGPWVDMLREKDQSLRGKQLRLTKGVHLVFDQLLFPLRQAVYFDTLDGRMIFAIPREGKTYVGTTDTFYNQDPINPEVTLADKTYLINAVNYMFPTLNVTEEDIESSWAGVRPLIYEEAKGPSEISRKDEIWISNSGLVTIAGGKLTGYRKMAETVVDFIVKLLQKKEGQNFKACQTKHLPISGGHFCSSGKFHSLIELKAKAAELIGFSPEQYLKLVKRYGSNIERIFDIAKTYDQNNKYGLPLEVYVQIMYGIEEEMTVKPVDFFIRRTGALLFDIKWVYEWKQSILEIMADSFDWTEEEKNKAEKELETQLNNKINPEGKL
ncbi:glycerol-3-phosphate dehydrogenase/oxidase [Bacillus sp. EB600]|uniref:glycerol-3-phosphate dehydrogenase/oxidase n=1 Tax=Bacillus sp. EB600 TaxID=2806345 RepID=UPI00210B1A99|nr:glycerol-3-phosphate dehydrogenase/oxidase [Bacillus sp. EB600]MCQ6281898.1 glycerol-3-phosphate dehydrogenase/oxidase [Bacillus sp. EB600]